MSDVLDRVDSREMISFLVASQEFCIDISAVQEIRGWTMTTPVPHAPPHVKGVINLRGIVMPVIDLGARLGFGPTQVSERNVIIVAVIGDIKAGLLVDAVCETIAARGDQFQAVPSLSTSESDAFVTGILPLEGRMISLLAVEKIVDL